MLSAFAFYLYRRLHIAVRGFVVLYLVVRLCSQRICGSKVRIVFYDFTKVCDSLSVSSEFLADNGTLITSFIHFTIDFDQLIEVSQSLVVIAYLERYQRTVEKSHFVVMRQFESFTEV